MVLQIGMKTIQIEKYLKMILRIKAYMYLKMIIRL